MQKALFKMLSKLNKVIIPKYSKRDLSRLTKLDKALIAFRYWVTKNAL